MKFQVYAGGELVGWSALEGVDPSMGCVSGIFYPNENYKKIKDVIREYSLLCGLGLTGDQQKYKKMWARIEALQLVITPEQGEPLQPVGGISLIDYAEELGEEAGREINVLGLHHAVFAEHFCQDHDKY